MSVSKNTIVAVAADGVGVVSVCLGGFLTVAPHVGGRRLGLSDTDSKRRRALGAADLVLGIAIIASRSSPRRWRAVAARALFHLLFAREYMRSDRRHIAVAMCGLFVLDAGIAVGLRQERHSV